MIYEHYANRLLVQQTVTANTTVNQWNYTFTFSSVLDAGFGILTGALNAFPTAFTSSSGSTTGSLFIAGEDMRSMRKSLKAFNDDLELNKMSTAVGHLAKAISYVNSTTFNLYFGGKTLLTST